ncbi:MAG: membrane protein insertase YidC [Gemmatimonadota bacterium]
MERRVLLAVVLSIGLIFLVNTLFPPVQPPPAPPASDTVVAAPEDGGEDAEAEREQDEDGVAEGVVEGAGGDEAADPDGGAEEVEADTIVVRSELYEYAFSTRGASVVGARLLNFRSYAEGDPEDAPVELVPEGGHFFDYGIVVGGDTVRLADRSFTPSGPGFELSPDAPRDSLGFVYEFPGAEARFVVTYHFRGDGYLLDVTGRVEGLERRGYALLSGLEPGLHSNEKNRDEDLDQLAIVTNGEESHVQNVSLGDVDPDEVRPAEGGPFHWVAFKNKYFLAAAIAPDEGPMFGGATIRGLDGEHAARVAMSMPVPAGSAGFRFGVYMGPQDYGRLDVIGQDLRDVNTYGYQWLQPVIRPLVAIVMPILTWMHTRFDLAYGWVLILFGVLMRVVLFPLYTKSMRAQIGQMRLQPVVQEIREKYKDDPQKMQQEMMRVYKEEGVNPLAGCLPMLVPMPILFTLFFVFQGTIEFRGVPFMWLPDLSLKDPLYIIPVVMGLSMFLLQWIGQRSMTTTNTQMKVLMYGMPVFLTFLFANFPSGLNLYYTTSNVASLPQQLYIARERKAAGVGQPETGEGETDGKGGKGGKSGGKGGRSGKGGRRSSGRGRGG